MAQVEDLYGRPPLPDNEPPHRSIRFQAADSSGILPKHIDALNAATEQMENLYDWATLNETALSINPQVVLQQLNDENFIENVRCTLNIIYSNMVAIQNGDLAPLDSSAKQSPQVETITLSNKEELQASVRTIRHAHHGLTNAAYGLTRAVEFAQFFSKEVCIPDLEQKFFRFSSRIDLLMDDLKHRYPKEKIQMYDVLYTIRDWLDFLPKENQKIHVSFLKNPSEVRGSVFYSIPWLETLVVDIGQNAVRSNAKKVTVSVKQETVKGKKYRDIIFDDDGDDPDPDIVEHGFQYEVSRHQGEKGTGTAMDYHRKVLQDYYGGDLTLEYRTDEQGNHTKGARVRLRLPIASS